ncbi:DNA ligase 4 [Daktulosphaira vitifoliae]|uniref:DNA ligase 4 n=1 Tax=Daktulosphaira vitifoliae TaxID=58002 RepID=UPI0021A9BD96|nr:DNA ligase 4 [Daktulosphaira vitifoliae]
MENNSTGKISFKLFCRACEDISNAALSERKVAILQKFMGMYRGTIEQSSDIKIEETFYPILRCLLPDLDKERGSYSIKELMLGKIYVNILRLAKDSQDAQKLINFRHHKISETSVGDFGDIVYQAVYSRLEDKDIMTVDEINSHLDNLILKHVNHEPKQVENILQMMLLKMNALQQKWLVRLLLKNMCLGITQTKILNIYHQDANELYNVSNSLVKICAMLNNPANKLHEIAIKLFDPFTPMLSQRCNITDLDKTIKVKNDLFYVDTKLKGERLQLHWDGKLFKYFSRRGNEYTDTYDSTSSMGILSPALAKCFHSSVKNCILDGNIMCYNTKLKSYTTKVMNSDVKMLRIGNTHQPCFYVFDVVYLNDKVLTNETLEKRLEILSTIIIPLEGICMFATHHVAKKNELINYLNQAIDNRDKGIVVKDPLSIYKPGTRTSGWYKIKPEYIKGTMVELDLLIIGGFYGKGRQRNSISHFLLGLMEKGDNFIKFYSIGRVGSGCSDEELVELSNLLDPHWKQLKPGELIPNIDWNKEKPDLWIDPKSSVLLQIKATEIVSNSVFKSGTMLRFPRIQQVRYDKPWNNCMTVKEFEEILKQADGKLCNEHKGDSQTKIRKAQESPKLNKKLRVTDVRSVIKSSDILEGKEFCVMSDSETLSKSEIERKIHEYGGVTIPNPSNNTFCVLTNGTNIRINAIKMKGEHSIVNIKWILLCFNENEFINWTPEDVLALSKEHKVLMDEKFDNYGDSYFENDTVDSLRMAMNRVELNDVNMTEESFIKFQRDLFSEITCFKTFGKCFVYFDNLDLDNLPTRNFHLNSVLEMIIFKFNGGTVCPKINNETTHVVVHSSNQNSKKTLENINSKRQIPFEIVDENWIKSQIKW